MKLQAQFDHKSVRSAARNLPCNCTQANKTIKEKTRNSKERALNVNSLLSMKL